MINLPYIPYIIFSIVMLSGMVLGYKRGWRISLYAAILSVIAFAISYGLFAIFYEQIASLISEHLYNRLGNPLYDWSDILVMGRPIIFTIAISISYLPVVGILWGVTYPLYKKINKKNYPKELNKISDNERTVSTPNVRKNRVGGLLIGTVNTTITASIVTSAVAAVFISSATFSPLFTITDGISSVISGGLLGNPLAYQYLIDFMPYTNDATFMSAISSLVRPSDSTLMTQEEIDILGVEEHRQVLKNIFSVEESTIALLDTIDQHGNNITWKPLEVLDDPTYAPTTSALDNLLSGNIALGLSTKEASNVVNWILSNTIQDFKDTRYYIEWAAAEAIRIAAEEELDAREAERDAYIDEIITQVAIYNSDINSLDSLVYEHNEKLAQIPALTIDKDNKYVIEQSEWVDRESLRLIMENEERTKDLEYSAYLNEKSDYDAFVSLRDSKEAEYMRYDSEISILNSEIATLESTVSSLQSEKSLKDASLPGLESARIDMWNLRNSAQSALDSANSTVVIRRDEFEDANTLLLARKTAWENVGSPDEGIEWDNYQDAIAEERLAETNYDNALSDADSKNSEYVVANSNYIKANAELIDLQSEITSLESSIQTANNSISSKEGSVSLKTTQRSAAFTLYETNRDNAVAQKVIMDNAQDDYTAANLIYVAAKLDFDRQDSVWNTANNRYEAANNLLVETQTRVDTLSDTTIPAIDTDLGRQYSSIDILFQRLANIEYKNITVSSIDSTFRNTISLTGGSGSDWTMSWDPITKTTYVEDPGTETDSIPYQIDWLLLKIDEEVVLEEIRDEKDIEFVGNVADYKNMLLDILTQ